MSDNVIEFKRKEKPVYKEPETYWERYKTLLRKHFPPPVVERIVAAILDKECYELTDQFIRDAADIYFKNDPKNKK